MDVISDVNVSSLRPSAAVGDPAGAGVFLRPQRMRDREFKYIYFADPEFPPILFDLRSDPDELNNVAGLAEYAAIELSCCHKLLRWRMYNEDQRMEHWAQPLREAD